MDYKHVTCLPLSFKKLLGSAHLFLTDPRRTDVRWTPSHDIIPMAFSYLITNAYIVFPKMSLTLAVCGYYITDRLCLADSDKSWINWWKML